MKFVAILISLIFLTSCGDVKVKSASITSDSAVSAAPAPVASNNWYIDVHDLEPGKVSFADVEAAHKKDLATEGKYHVSFKKFWLDEKKGKVYCLSQARDAGAVEQTHREAHGLVPSVVYQVSEGMEAQPKGSNRDFFLDVHELGPGAVTAKDVAGAHEKDLAAQKQFDVNFINYWVDEKRGVVMCLSEAPDSAAVKKTHQQAHGLLPAYVLKVKQGE